jgi:SM-20-related protein
MFTFIVDAIADRGYAVVPDFLAPTAIDALRSRALSLDAAGELTPARIGRGTNATRRDDVRGDRIRWLDERDVDSAETPLRAALEDLRVAANQELQLGLFDFEGHYAIYPPEAGYARHRDRFCDDDARVLSVVLYLNEDWRADDGGTLRLFIEDAAPVDVAPEGGTLVTFLSDRFDHEVLPARRARIAIAGWFRRRV